MTGHLKRFTASATGEGFGDTTLYARILEKVTLRNRSRGARSFCTLARSIAPSHAWMTNSASALDEKFLEIAPALCASAITAATSSPHLANASPTRSLITGL